MEGDDVHTLCAVILFNTISTHRFCVRHNDLKYVALELWTPSLNVKWIK